MQLFVHFQEKKALKCFSNDILPAKYHAISRKDFQEDENCRSVYRLLPPYR